MTRNLLKELLEPPKKPVRQGASAYVCSLTKKLDHCCNGNGFRLSAEGAFAKASICDCVQSCPLCFGRARHDNDNGDSVACKTPSPLRMVGLINEAQVPARYKDARLPGFVNHTGNGKDVVADVKAWCMLLGQHIAEGTAKGFVLWGEVGVGKTYLLCAVAFELLRQQFTVRFIDFFQLLMELRGAYSENGSDASVLKPLLAVDVLIIDEMGKGRNTDWELSVLDQLVMGRYNRNKLIIASTNYSPQVLPDEEHHATSSRQDSQKVLDKHRTPERSGERPFSQQSLKARVGVRIFSRLHETTDFWELRGKDYRRERAVSTVG